MCIRDSRYIAVLNRSANPSAILNADNRQAAVFGAYIIFNLVYHLSLIHILKVLLNLSMGNIMKKMALTGAT